jgi:hypothetical protein
LDILRGDPTLASSVPICEWFDESRKERCRLNEIVEVEGLLHFKHRLQIRMTFGKMSGFEDLEQGKMLWVEDFTTQKDVLESTTYQLPLDSKTSVSE